MEIYDDDTNIFDEDLGIVFNKEADDEAFLALLRITEAQIKEKKRNESNRARDNVKEDDDNRGTAV